ncbi:hypothetical protein KUTeg_009266 [Tegillarca granosa]|uniref:Uncharacterized protein n=1 Tax=Tegillarca granosa TaxID=220873 RepID=A0ABQ9F9A0_TEGGR|nr:hypothetical protein KUTeg_009266 [Tegillarca granosa]
MRHRASTIHAGRNVSESDKKIFYQHMGHSAEINENVYQCRTGLKEITVVGGFLTGIDAFFGPLVTQTALIRAVTGRGLVNEDEIESTPELLLDSKDVLCDPVIQAQMREYFTDDAWSTVMSTIKLYCANAKEVCCPFYVYFLLEQRNFFSRLNKTMILKLSRKRCCAVDNNK